MEEARPVDSNKGLKATQSGFLNTEAGEAEAFCDETFSWYNWYLRKFNGFVIILICYCIFSNSYAFFFKTSELSTDLNDLADVLYILLVFLRSRTGNLIDGVEERNLLKVRQRYQTSIWFFLDIITMIPFTYIGTILPGHSLYYSVIEKQTVYLRLHYVLYFIGLKEQESGSSTTRYRVLMYLLISSAMIHFLACGWYGLACSNMGYTDFRITLCTEGSWMLKYLIEKIHAMEFSKYTMKGTYADQVKHLPSPYLMSLYWASSTSFSTGFGDIHAFTASEKIYSTFAMLGGVGFLYGMTVSGITSLMINTDARRAQFVHYYNAFKQELDNLHLGKQAKDICLRYLDFLWVNRKGTELVNMNILPILPQYLQTLFAEYTYQPLLYKADVFASADEAFMSSLARMAKHVVYLRGQYVQMSGEIPAAMCYVEKGVIEILGPDDVVLDVLQEGSVFGQGHVTCGLPRLNTLHCQIDTELFILQRQDFAKVLLDYPEVSNQIKSSVERLCIDNHWPLQLNTMYSEELLGRRRQSIQTSIAVDVLRWNSTRRQSIRRMSCYLTADMMESSDKKTPAFDIKALENSSDVVRRSAVRTVDFHGVELSRPVTTSHTSRYGDSVPEVKARRTVDPETGLKQQMPQQDAQTTDKESGEETFWQRLERLTILEANGKFQKIWEIYLLVISIISYNLTIFLPFVMASVGKQKVYSGDEVKTLPLLNIAKDGLYSFEAPIAEALARCDYVTELHALVQCIRDSNGHMSKLISGNISEGYTVIVPSTYDLEYFGFNETTFQGIFFVLVCYCIIDLSFYANILVNLRTKVLTNSGILTSFKEIRRHYLKWDRFGLDLLIVFPLEILAPILSNIVWHGTMGRHYWWLVLRGNRALCLAFHVPRILGKQEKSLDVNIVSLRLAKVIVYIMSVSHTMASFNFGWSCSYPTKIGFDFTEDRIYHEMCFRGSQGWKDGISWDNGHFAEYTLDFYYVATIATSTGYGDIPSGTTTKMVFAMANMAIGTMLFGWLMAVIASGLSSDATATVLFSNAVKDTKAYLTVNSVPSALVNRVLNCQYIQWVRYGGTAIPGVNGIGHNLSENINELFMYEGTREYVERVPLFHKLPPALISMLCNRIETHHYSKGDVIIYEGDLCSAVHIIRQGHCIVVSSDLEHKIGALHPGDYFCELKVLHGLSSSRTIVADSTCEMLLLYSEDIFDTLDLQGTNLPLHKMFHQPSYELDIVATLHKQRMNKFENEFPMKELYAIQQVASGVRCYGDSVIDNSCRIYHEDSVGGILQYLLLPFTLDPNTKPYMIYETIRVILAIATMIVMPLQIAFFPQQPSLMTIQYLLDAACFFDQYIKLHTMYNNDREILVYDPVSTAIHYLKTGFFGDLVSWFPFEVFVLGMPGPWSANQWKFFSLFRLPRFLQAIKVSRYFDFWIVDIRHKRRYVHHIKTAIFTILLHHWISCLLFTFSCYPEFHPINHTEHPGEWIELSGTRSPMYVGPETWMGRLIVEDDLPALSIPDSITVQYIVSLYWATATLVCVGYGDIFPINIADRLIATFTMYLGLVYYALILGGIAAHMQMDDMNRATFKKRLNDIKKFFKVHHVSTRIENQVMSYYCYLWDRNHGVTTEHLLRGLSPSLKTSVCQNMYGEMLRESFGCSKNLETTVNEKDINGFFRFLSTKIQPQIYLKRTVIFSRGNVGDEMYFIQQGNVAIYEEDDETIFKVLGPGQFFGEAMLFLDVTRQRTVTAITNCDLNVLNKKDLDSILNAFPRFETIMKDIANERRVVGTSSLTYKRRNSIADFIQNIDYDGEGNRNDGQDKYFFFKVIDRDSRLARIWDNVTVVLAFISSCLVIYQAAYHNRNPTLDALGFLMDVWFILDMVVAFHTSYLDKFGNVVDAKEKIHEYYGKTRTRFLFDAIANVPLDIFGHAGFVNGSYASTCEAKFALLSLFRLNRVLRLRKFFENFDKWERDLHRDTLTVRMYKFALCLFFVINLFGSCFFFVGCPLGVCHPMSWTTTYMSNYKNKGVLHTEIVPWVDGCYWVVATMTTTGYGDIKPETLQEIVYSCIVMVCGKLVIGYALSMLAATLANDDARRVWYQERVSAVANYMNDRKFDTKVSELVIRYYDYIWMKNQGADITSLFGDLCYSLRADIFYEICGESVESVGIFDGCSRNFIRLLCTKLRQVAFMPGEYICSQGDVRSEMFLIYRGIAEVFETDDEHNIKPIRLILEGESYLCQSVLQKIRLTCTIRARTYVDAFFLQMEDLQDTIEIYKHDRDLVLENAYKIYGIAFE